MHGLEAVPWFVMESGRQTLLDGTTVEASKASSNQKWKTVNFSQPFASPPVVLTGVMTENDASAIVVRMRNISTTSFQIKVQEAEGDDKKHGAETIGWIALLAGSHNLAGLVFEAGQTPDQVRHNFVTVPDASPLFVASLATTGGGDTSGLRRAWTGPETTPSRSKRSSRETLKSGTRRRS